jgi:alpha-glucosidase
MTTNRKGIAKAIPLILASVLMLGVSCRSGRDGSGGPLSVSSPDGNLTISLSLKANPQPYLPSERPYYRVTYKGAAVLADSPLGLDFAGAAPLDQDFAVSAADRETQDSTWENPFGARRTVVDHYHQLTVSLQEKRAPGQRLVIVLRAYDEGVAFRYVLPKQDAIGAFTLAAETTGFDFAGDASALALNMGRFITHNEGPYLRTALRDIKPASIINLPLLVEMPGGGCAAILTPAKNESTAPNKGSRHPRSPRERFLLPAGRLRQPL